MNLPAKAGSHGIYGILVFYLFFFAGAGFLTAFFMAAAGHQGLFFG